MTFKSYRTNTDFDILHFVGKDAHTPDGKYVLYMAQRNILEENYKRFLIANARRKKQIEFLRSLVENSKELDKYAEQEKKWDLEELLASEKNDQLNLEGGQAEIEFYDRIIEELRPHCKYIHLGLIRQQEAVQREEWRLEFIERAKTYIQSVGHIPPDQLTAMKAHPDFKEVILPQIQWLTQNKAELLEYRDIQPADNMQLPLLDGGDNQYKLTA